eukprot:scaffold14848_cov79-Skeletonema_marinoi.AAC.2
MDHCAFIHFCLSGVLTTSQTNDRSDETFASTIFPLVKRGERVACKSLGLLNQRYLYLLQPAPMQDRALPTTRQYWLHPYCVEISWALGMNTRMLFQKGTQQNGCSLGVLKIRQINVHNKRTILIVVSSISSTSVCWSTKVAFH